MEPTEEFVIKFLDLPRAYNQRAEGGGMYERISYLASISTPFGDGYAESHRIEENGLMIMQYSDIAMTKGHSHLTPDHRRIRNSAQSL